jgi:hypothetical protein
MNNLDQIVTNVNLMREDVLNGAPFKDILAKYEDFMTSCPKLFEMILENKEDYLPELSKMIKIARKVESKEASLEQATKVVKVDYDNKYIYPVLKTPENKKKEQEDYIKEQNTEAEQIKRKWQDIN